jgi:phosphopantetheine adenylyltransferase
LITDRYGEVIAVVGMNPDKKYVVTPTERAQFIQDMISEKGIKGEIRVEGTS